MPEPDGEPKDFFTTVPPPDQGFFLKGSGRSIGDEQTGSRGCSGPTRGRL